MGDSSADRLKQAVAFETKARELESAGRYGDAYKEYKNAVEVFKFVFRWDPNPMMKDLVKDKLEELMTKTESLKKTIDSGVVVAAPPAAPARPGSAATAVMPPAEAAADDTDKEKERLRRGLEGAIIRETPNVKFDDVAGLKGAKAALEECVFLPKTHPQLFQGKREPWRAILLYGPPGTGKTHLARACATESGSTFFALSSSDLVSKWMGESEQLVKNLFELAHEHKPSIVFIDEVDSLCGARGEGGESDAARRIKTEFLAQMDGVTKSKTDETLVLGATNVPWDLDTAIRRRFEKRVYIPLPDLEGRIRQLTINVGDTRNSLTQEDLVQIARRADGYSGADIGLLVRDAIFEPVRRCQRARAFRRVQVLGPDGVTREYWAPCSPALPDARQMSMKEVPGGELLEPDVTAADFEVSLSKVRPSVGPEDLVRHVEWTQVYGQDGNQ